MSKLSFQPRFHTRTHDGHYFCTAPVHVAPALQIKVVNESAAIIREGGSVLGHGPSKQASAPGPHLKSVPR